MRRIALLLILPLFSLHALAAPLKFVEHNFSVEIPPGWSAIVPQPKDSLLAVQSPTTAEKFLVFATKTSTKNHPDAAQEVREGDKKKLGQDGNKVDPDEETVINGVKFVAFTAHSPKGGLLTEYTANSGDQVYLLQAIATNADGAKDTQLQAAVQSFSILGTPASPEVPTAPGATSQAQNSTYRLVLSSLIVVAVIMFLRRLMARRPR